ncbi:hypothetical protein Q4555_07280 [Octadecabacter sp. 1_MG-2023]|uniref:hypothetical protein n=1 Tax=unclassified Octadecabacter TaxID=196158 RepID=UPI001C088B85|nr:MULTISPECIES: hypothetical protein [unclassified Octadecabacter]MBU2994246.1 hypothetical protein [Octadecabacter sp. B2R22]MDO6734465.1 hypothetical protein [Octadecabacter sp. 1_MG-2023]
MLHKTLVLIPLIALAACGTPRERCIAGANRPVASLDQLIATTRGNIERGYALVEVEDVRVLRRTCEGVREDGTKFRYRCDETETFTRREPVTIDIANERRKLAQFIERRETAVQQAQATTQQCIAVHPE